MGTARRTHLNTGRKGVDPLQQRPLLKNQISTVNSQYTSGSTPFHLLIDCDFALCWLWTCNVECARATGVGVQKITIAHLLPSCSHRVVVLQSEQGEETMGKRGADEQITKDGCESGERAGEETQQAGGSFQQASAEKLAQRRILKARRRTPSTQAAEIPSAPADQVAAPAESGTKSQPAFTWSFGAAKASTSETNDADKTTPAENASAENGDKPKPTFNWSFGTPSAQKEEKSESKTAEAANDVATASPAASATVDAKKPSESQENGAADTTSATADASGNEHSTESADNATSKDEKRDSAADTPAEAASPKPSSSSADNPSSEAGAQSDQKHVFGKSFLSGAVTFGTFKAPSSGDGGFGGSEAVKTEVPDASPAKVETKLLDVPTGEEDETTLVSCRAKLHRWTKGESSSEWVSCGVGDLHINEHKASSSKRMLMRTDRVGRLILNCALGDSAKATKVGDKQLQVVALDNSTKGEDPKPIVYRIRVQSAQVLDKLLGHC